MSIATTSPYVFYTFVFIIGLIFGSFINVLIYRLPRGESIIYPPSHCTKCGSSIRFYHNIPVFSYIALKGKCSSCFSGISLLYPVVELLTAFFSVLLFYKFGLETVTFVYVLLVFALIAVTFIDLEHLIIPNRITLPGIVVGFLCNVLITDWSLLFEKVKHIDLLGTFNLVSKFPALDSFMGVVIGGGLLYLIAFLYELIRKTEGMGMGDVKLLAMLGAFLGIKGVFFTLLVSSLIGSVIGLMLIFLRVIIKTIYLIRVWNLGAGSSVGLAVKLAREGDLRYEIPYGPFLSIGAVTFIFTRGYSFPFYFPL